MGTVKIVRASAGSGKTYSLVYEYIRNLITDPTRYRNILAVTFTNKATDEMKQRILSRLNDLANHLPDAQYRQTLVEELDMDERLVDARALTARTFILHDYNRFAVMTIDKFFQRIIRQFLHELGIDANYQIELKTDTLLENATDMVIDNIASDSELRQWVLDYIGENIDDKGKWDFKQSLLSLGKEIFSEQFKQVDTTGYTKEALKKQASQMAAQAKRLKKEAMDRAAEFIMFVEQHGLSDADFFGGKQRGVAAYARKIAQGLLSVAGANVLNAINNGTWCTKSSPNNAVFASLSVQLADMLKAVVDTVHSAQKAENSWVLMRHHYRNLALIIDIRNSLDQLGKEQNMLHISEIGSFINQLVDQNEAPFIFEKVGTTFDRFLIDEFQDTSLLQWNNFQPLLRNALAQAEDEAVMLVGDVKQSIYRWRGSDWRILGQMADKAFDSSQIVHRTLDVNRRSMQRVVEFNNSLIDFVQSILNGVVNQTVWTAHDNGVIDQQLFDSLNNTIKDAYSDCQQQPAKMTGEGYVQVVRFSKGDQTEQGTDDQTEVETEGENFEHPLIKLVEDLQHRGYRLRDIALLVRTNVEGQFFADMLLGHKAKHPESEYRYDVITQDSLLIGRSQACALVMSCMKMAVNEHDSINRALFNSLLGRHFCAELDESEIGFLHRIEVMSPEQAFEEIVLRYRLFERESQFTYLQALHRQTIGFTNQKVADLRLFTEWWDKTGSRESIAMPEKSDAITIATIHKSKGLEFKVVIIPKCDWSTIPDQKSIVWSKMESEHGNDKDNEAETGPADYPVNIVKIMAESVFSQSYYNEFALSAVDSLNMLYVAVTRACNELYIMLPYDKHGNVRGIGQIVDDFVIKQDGVMLTALDNENSPVRRFKYGTQPQEVKSDAQADNVMKCTFPTWPLNDRVEVKFSFQRYLDSNPQSRLYPLNFGVMMHRVFEQADSLEQIEQQVAQMALDGSLGEEQMKGLRTTIDNALKNPTIRSWFDSSWDDVRNENSILAPDRREWRPDRVMTKQDRAVVVDYKFGLNRKPSHIEQVRQYMALLAKMGYKQTEGYVWYISLDDVEHVEL